MPADHDVPTTEALGRAPERILRPERARPSDIVRPTRAEIDLAAVRHNFRLVARAAGSAEVWAVLKADAYGHGSKALGRTLERAGAQGLCVALLEEAVELREAGIQCPILVMGGYYARAWDAVLAHRLTPVLYERGQLDELAAEARFRGAAPVGVHLKVDTGMGRLGALPAELVRLGEHLKALPELELAGLMTHFACADSSDPEAVEGQLDVFDATTAALASRGLSPRRRHAANSAALFRVERARLDLVRPGLALFGVEPTVGMCPLLRPAMTVHTRVVALRDIPPGNSVGYGWTWTARRPSRIATIPIGYADGFSRGLSSRGAVLLRGRRCPVVGVVSMDLTTVDVTDAPGVELGDECVVLGSQQGPLGTDAITAHELAEQLGTIPWEILTSVSRRVPRFYRNA